MKFYSKKPNKVGGGSKTNKNGLSFEGRTNLIQSLDNNKNISIVDTNKIYYSGKYVGYYCEKHSFYNRFLQKNNIDWKSLISKKYLPDGVLVNELNKTVYVVEKKFQESSGSVDEKLQTCDFKKKIYTRLIEKTGYKTEYYYLWNDWFLRDEYDDVKKYIKSVGCKYFIDEIDFNELGIN